MQTVTILSAIFVLLSFFLCAFADPLPTTWVPIGASTNPATVTTASISAIAALAEDMYDRWYDLDAACDPRAVFAVAYLFMTHNARILIQNNYFDDGNKMASFILDFASRYIDAFTQWDLGHTTNVSLPWRVYFNTTASNRSDVTQDITIGMNAHINYDLAISAYKCGYAVPQWKDDYYRVNDLMLQVDDEVTLALARYDPLFDNTDPASQTYFQASIDLVTSWRTLAYNQAEGYQNCSSTPSPATCRSTAQTASEASVGAAGQALAVPYPYQTAPSRREYCSTHHYDLEL